MQKNKEKVTKVAKQKTERLPSVSSRFKIIVMVDCCGKAVFFGCIYLFLAVQ